MENKKIMLPCLKRPKIYLLLVTIIFCISCGQNQKEGTKMTNRSKTKALITRQGPQTITRNIIQDRKGNIWIAAFDGIFRYDGKLFTSITSKISSARFFSVLEDRKGGLWFGSIGSGVFHYDGKAFQNFTTKNGLLNNEVTSIYEDKLGNIWFGVSGGASRYNGNVFQNYIIEGNSMKEDRTGKTFPNRRPYEVTAIVEDHTGKFWFATRGNTFVYNGKTFNVFTHENQPFKNVRSMIEDTKGNIWLGGADGLWRYNPSTAPKASRISFTNFTQQFVGHIIEDKKGNIWISSENSEHKSWNLRRSNGQQWALSRYDAKTLTNVKPMESKIKSGENMIFGILEANDGSIWFGSMSGVNRYDGKTITDFNSVGDLK